MKIEELKISEEDLLQIPQLEKEWRENQPFLSLKGWLEILPEARPYLKSKLKELEEKARKLSNEVFSSQLRILKSYDNNFTRGFFLEIVKVWRGNELDKTLKEIRKIKGTLFPKKAKGGITEEQIERVRQVPFEEFIEVRRDFALCPNPNHSDHRPSFYVKSRENSYGYCFSCQYSCDIIKFIMDKNNFSFKEAVELLLNYC